jgi:hypothetical protein
MSQSQTVARVEFREQNRDIGDPARRANARKMISSLIQSKYPAEKSWIVIVYDEGMEMSLDFTYAGETQRLNLAGLESDPAGSLFVKRLELFLDDNWTSRRQ